MSEPAVRLCADAGLSFEATERSLVVPCANAPVDLLLVRTDDIPEYVQDGVVDVGITGANLVVETEAECRHARGARLRPLHRSTRPFPPTRPQQSVSDLAGLRVATAYPVSTGSGSWPSWASSARSSPSRARSRRRRGWGWPMRSSTSSRPARR